MKGGKRKTNWKGKGKGNRFKKNRSIRQATTGDENEEEEDSQPEERESYTMIRALLQKLPQEERIRVLMDTEEDF